jgi:AcrR family transcriptional regulator
MTNAAKASVAAKAKARAAVKKVTRDKAATGTAGSTGRATGWQAEKSAMTRTAILEAAIRCFVNQGYTKTTTAMIAAEAGVSRGAMMHHFPSRSAVMQAVVAYLHDRRISEYRELMADIDLQEDELTRTDIRKSVQAAWDYVNLPSFIAYQELNAAARTDAELSDVIEAVERDFERQFLRTVKAVFPQWKKLKSLQAAHDLVQFVMNGMATSYRLSNRKKRAERVIDLVTDQLVHIYEIERSD